MHSIAILALAAASLVTSSETRESVRVERRLSAMGTALTIQVDAVDRATGLEASEIVARAIEGTEARLSTWREDSELSRLDRAPVGEAVELSDELAADLAAAHRWWVETEGAFDPSVGGLVDAWDLRGSGRRPSGEEIRAALVAGGFGALELAPASAGRPATATRRAGNLRIEEGAFGKGRGLDAAVTALDAAGLTGVFGVSVDLGGQVAVLGDGRAFDYALADPRDRGRPALSLSIERGSMATSGNGERAVVVAGERIGHLLDPKTGEPSRDFGSLTVWAEDATAADCLSTALYVRGPDAALAYAASHAGVEVLALEVDGDFVVARASDGWADRVVVLGEDVVLETAGVAGASPGAGAALAAGAVVATAALATEGQGGDAQAPVGEERMDELERRIDVVAGEVERQEHGSVFPPVGPSEYGLGPASSKVYRVDHGVSLGGYGDLIYQNPDQGPATFDFLRAVLYVGYRFDEHWLFNSELEFEHATTGKSGSTSVEFAYLDYLASDPLNARAGLLLMPMGIYNEVHEPTTYLPARRPGLETEIIPTTWRENGGGIFGTLADQVDYRTYIVNGLDAAGFSANGLRGGRQKGSQALADDLAWVGRADWHAAPGVTLGGSAYAGGSGQVLNTSVPTLIYEAHADLEWRQWTARGLFTQAQLDNVEELNNELGLVGTESIGESLEGFYVELGYDVMAALRPTNGQALSPFLRYEHYNTQSEVPTGFTADPANDKRILTYGVAWQPNDQIIFKIDYQDVDNEAGTGVSQLNIAMGYVF